jgi:methanogenic corrinoid protein MtbC1
MNLLNDVAAEMLEASAAGYAAAAVAALESTAAASPPGTDGATWKSHFTQRVLELAAAVRVAQPELFAQRVNWLRRAARARGAGEQELKQALLCLQTAMQREIPDSLRPAIAPALELAVATFEDTLASGGVTLDAGKPLDRLALQYLALCLEGDPQQAIDLVLRTAQSGLPPAVVYTQLLIAAEKEIGELWHVGDVSIAEERVVSETTREVMALLVSQHRIRRPNGPSLVAAAVAGNSHDIGLRAVADLFRLDGWRCLFLGANVPAMEIARAADTFDVDLVVLNATLATQLKPLEDAIATIRAASPERRILVGGLAFDGLPELWKQLGADALAPTIDTAVDIGTRLVGTR